MPNALVHEKSPYLLQHAENPVDWLPWGEAAFAKARAEQKPIFLSIGYATCHWCHVMARESFEDAAVAQRLNESFVAIKVDREERPDVDRVYMSYVQAMTGHGGWPLSAWLTPELKPFFGGTYFPLEDGHGRPGFGSLLRAIAHGWATDRAQLVNESDRVVTALREHYAERSQGGGEAVAKGERLEEAASGAFERCFQYFYEAFDPKYGGFGSAPKFPRASNLSFLFRAAVLQGLQSEAGAEAIRLATATLQAMARGGIHDHVGGGYHRYSVDESWFVPHFEKMLYDQAQIAMNALEAKQATGDERYAWMARDVFDYVLRDLTHARGGFFSAEDADSEVGGEAGVSVEDTEHGRDARATTDHGRDAHATTEHAEGAFYVWTRAELAAVLGEDAAAFAAHFGITEEGNVPAALDPHQEFVGRNILMQRQSIVETANEWGLSPEQASERLHAALQKLRAVRAQRPRPLRDDKIITAWNGLMISALAKAHHVLGLADDATDGDRYLQAANRAAEFVERELFDEPRGVLFRSWREGRSAVEGFAEDYAFLIQGLLDLYEAGFDVRWLRWAERLQRTMDERFWDEEHGGYFNSAADDPHLVLRLKEDYDGAEPAPSSVAAMNLLRLGAVFDAGERGGAGAGMSYRERGERTIAAFREQWTRTPHGLPQMLCALELLLIPPGHVVLAGEPTQAGFRELHRESTARLGPRRVVLGMTSEESRRWLSERAPWLAGQANPNGRPTAYVCERFVCQAPVDSPEGLRAALQD